MHQGSKSCCRFKQFKEKGLPIWNHLPQCSPCWLASHRDTFWKTQQLELFRAVTYTEWDHLNSLLLCQISCKSVQIKIMAFGWRCFPFSPRSFFIFPEPPPSNPVPAPLLFFTSLTRLPSWQEGVPPPGQCIKQWHWQSLIPSDRRQFKRQEKISRQGWGLWMELVIITLKGDGLAVAVPSSGFSWLCPEDHPHHSK